MHVPLVSSNPKHLCMEYSFPTHKLYAQFQHHLNLHVHMRKQRSRPKNPTILDALTAFSYCSLKPRECLERLPDTFPVHASVVGLSEKIVILVIIIVNI